MCSMVQKIKKMRTHHVLYDAKKFVKTLCSLVSVSNGLKSCEKIGKNKISYANARARILAQRVAKEAASKKSEFELQ